MLFGSFSLQEKLCDIETEEQILRQQVMVHSSSAASMRMPHSATEVTLYILLYFFFYFYKKNMSSDMGFQDQENGTTHVQRSDSNSKRPGNDRQNVSVFIYKHLNYVD